MRGRGECPGPCLTQVGGSGRLLQRLLASARPQARAVVEPGNLSLYITISTSTLSAN